MGILLGKMVRKALILVTTTTLVLVQANLQLDIKWQDFKLRHSKSYFLGEEESRRAIWEDNHRFIQEHNLAYERGTETYSVAENKFMDLSNFEFARKLTATLQPRNSSSNKIFEPFGTVTRSTVDWREEGYVTPVKDQGDCSSCWAFSTTGTLEGAHFKKTGQLVSLSEQNLVDCSTPYGNLGCGGGYVDTAFKYIKENGGVATEEAYPYTGKQGECRFDSNTIGATLTGWQEIRWASESDLESAVSEIGPVSASIDASNRGFQFYKEGVYYDPDCDSFRMNHAILVVGYGEENGENYWIVKNSWDETWGDKGYIKMAKDRDNHCGIASDALFPLV